MRHKTQQMKNYLLFTSLVMLLGACTVDEPIIPNEEELITTVIYELTPEGGGEVVELKFTDIDGDGGQAPVVNSGQLISGTNYSGNLKFLNESVSPVDDITAEVLEEGAEHQVFFQTSSTLNLTVTYEDMDENGDPIGLKTKLRANTKTNGSLTIILKHEPNKKGMSVSSGDITNAGGETDVEVTFNVVVQ